MEIPIWKHVIIEQFVLSVNGLVRFTEQRVNHYQRVVENWLITGVLSRRAGAGGISTAREHRGLPTADSVVASRVN